MLAVELLKNHVILLTWSCKQPLNGVPNSLDQISCQCKCQLRICFDMCQLRTDFFHKAILIRVFNGCLMFDVSIISGV